MLLLACALYLTRLEMTTLSLLPRAGAGEAFAQVEPTLIVDGGAAEVRWRFLEGKLYAMGTGGTLLFPEAEGALRPGAFASVGLGGGQCALTPCCCARPCSPAAARR